MQDSTNMLNRLNLPLGYRFHPTDEEILVDYLYKKVTINQSPLGIIAEVDIYKFDPWQLPSKAIYGDNEWYFYSPRDKKYTNGSIKRTTLTGYWKASGRDKIIIIQGRKFGFKKTLVFYVREASKLTKTNWIMHEYRLYVPPERIFSKVDHWVICKIYKKDAYVPKPVYDELHQNNEESHVSSPSLSSQFDSMFESFLEMDFVTLAELDEPPLHPDPTQQYLNNTTVNHQNGMIMPEIAHPLVQTPQFVNNNNVISMPNDAPRYNQRGAEVESWTQTQTHTQSQTQRINNSGMILNSNASTWDFPDALEQFVAGYPNELGSFRFGED